MATVCIIGAGELGGAVADALARGGRAPRVLLVDPSGTVAAGKALDIQQSGAVFGFPGRLEGTNDMSRIPGCAAYVVADKFGPPSSEWQGDDGIALLTRVARLAGTSPIVFAGAASAPLMELAAREMHLAPARLIGSAPEALASALTAMVAMEAGCSPLEVRLAVLGSPAPGFVVPWGEAAIGGFSLERVLSQVQLARLEARAPRLWPPGPFTLGLAAARVVEGLLSSSRRSFSVLTILDGEFGVRGRAGALPAMLSTAGIVHTRIPTLSTRDRVLLETALSTR